ncbi:MAG: c-type cytochrome, partial [Bacteroidia bacterium]
MCIKPQKQFLAIFSLLFSLFIFSSSQVSAEDGEKIFKQNCAVCHSLGKNKITGPG